MIDLTERYPVASRWRFYDGEVIVLGYDETSSMPITVAWKRNGNWHIDKLGSELDAVATRLDAPNVEQSGAIAFTESIEEYYGDEFVAMSMDSFAHLSLGLDAEVQVWRHRSVL